MNITFLISWTPTPFLFHPFDRFYHCNGFQDGGRILIAPEKKTVVLKEK